MLRVTGLRTEIATGTAVVVAVDGATFAIAKGETFALVGESGCGKSVTALSVMRLLPDNARVGGGAIELDGADIVVLPEARMRDLRGRRVGIVFQEPATSLDPVMTVGAQVVETIERHTSRRGAAARERAVDWLRRVGVPEPERRFHNYPFELSGGQKQRVMIAVALAAEPELLIADEPTTALDVTIQAQILDLLRELQAENGMALLLITHDLAIVSQMAHRIALMYAGQVVETAAASTFFSRPLHPYARGLFGALPDMAKRGHALEAIPGTVPALDRPFTTCRFADRCFAVRPECRMGEPELIRIEDGHEVRCVLYRPGAAPGDMPVPGVALPGSLSREREREMSDAAFRVPLSGGRRETPGVALPGPLSRVAGEGGGEGAGGRNTAPLLEVSDYRVHFPIRTTGRWGTTHGIAKAVDGVSFRLEAGRTLALVGESGCGKTTTGKAILQLLRGKARIGGQALLDGEDLGAMAADALRRARRDMQIVFQDPHASLNPRMRVAEILEEGLLALRPEIDAAERRARTEALMETVGLRPDARFRYPHEFSGGQRQRIAIARALAVDPRLIICDEPTSALDVSVQAQILNLLRRLQQERGIAYLFITHNFGVVEYLADEVAVMTAGRIVETGPAQELIEHPQDPYTRRLLASVPRVRKPY